MFNCPCCHLPFYENMKLIDEAILVGQAVTIKTYIDPYLFPLTLTDILTSAEAITSINDINLLLAQKLEAAQLLNPTNFTSLYNLYCSYCDGLKYYTKLKLADTPQASFYRIKLFETSYKILDYPDIPVHYYNGCVRSDCYDNQAKVFVLYRNIPAALNHSKLAYEHCLRSSDYSDLASYKEVYLKMRASFAKLPPLRFAVGDEVEYLHELETGSEWKLGKITEL